MELTSSLIGEVICLDDRWQGKNGANKLSVVCCRFKSKEDERD